MMMRCIYRFSYIFEFFSICVCSRCHLDQKSEKRDSSKFYFGKKNENRSLSLALFQTPHVYIREREKMKVSQKNASGALIAQRTSSVVFREY